jgi:hypothetical protein
VASLSDIHSHRTLQMLNAQSVSYSPQTPASATSNRPNLGPGLTISIAELNTVSVEGAPILSKGTAPPAGASAGGGRSASRTSCERARCSAACSRVGRPAISSPEICSTACVSFTVHLSGIHDVPYPLHPLSAYPALRGPRRPPAPSVQRGRAGIIDPQEFVCLRFLVPSRYTHGQAVRLRRAQPRGAGRRSHGVDQALEGPYTA